MAGASGLLRDRDLSALSEVIEEGRRDDPGEAMPWAVVDGLLRLVPSQGLLFNEISLREQQPVIMQASMEGGPRGVGFGPEDKPPYPEYWLHRQHFRPSRHFDYGEDFVSVLRFSDFYTSSELKNTPFFAEYIRPTGMLYSVHVPLPAPAGRIRRISLSRDAGPDFSERDLLILRLLRPHLHEVYLDAERRRRGVPRLSRRERELLRLVAQGYSNADIAQTLFISVATVRKHMEHIFDRTGVRTRAAAAAVALRPTSAFTPLHPPDERP
jgi:DNA-binding CsgD family transcriptional regulator